MNNIFCEVHEKIREKNRFNRVRGCCNFCCHSVIRTLFSLIREHRIRSPSFRVNAHKYFVISTIYVQNQVNERFFFLNSSR